MTTLAYTVPQAGTDLNSVADPEIATALNTIKTWANGNIDTANLSAAALTALSPLAYRNAVSNITANPGDLIVAASGVTVTLPTPAAANTRIGIVAASSVTGASPVTVSFPGQTIYGPGYSGATLTLGTGAAYMILQSISTTQYVTVAGQQDTGWVALSLSTNINAMAGYFTPSVRVLGSQAYLRGAFQNNTGAATNNQATIPVAARPANTVILTVPNLSVGAMVAQITAAGAFSTIATQSNTSVIGLDGVAYSLL